MEGIADARMCDVDLARLGFRGRDHVGNGIRLQLVRLTSSTVTKRAVSEIGAKSLSASNGSFL